MDESHIIDQLRAGAEGVGTDDSDIDGLVAGAVVRGRRRRARRRVGAALSTVVAAAVVVTVVATGVVPTRLGSTPPGPADTPVIATPVVSATPPPAPTSAPPAPTPAPPTTTGRLSGTPAQVEVTVAGLLPDSTTVTRSVSDRTSSTEGRELDAYLTIRDAEGTSNLIAGAGAGHFSDVCASNSPCTKHSVAGGGTVWVVGGGHDPDKAGDDGSAYYNRPDGGRVWLSQSNYDQGNGPVTRKGLALSADEMARLVQSRSWDRFFRG